MQDENYEHNKSREEYYYLEKKGLCKFFKMLLASFFGTLLALCVFRVIHKPPMMPIPPMGQYSFNQPCPCGCMQRWKQHHRMLAPGEFKDRRFNSGTSNAPDTNRMPAPIPQAENISNPEK